MAYIFRDNKEQEQFEIVHESVLSKDGTGGLGLDELFPAMQKYSGKSKEEVEKIRAKFEGDYLDAANGLEEKVEGKKE